MIRALIGPLAGRHDLSAEDLEEAYAVPTPTLRANFVLSLDGAVALDGVSATLGGPADRAVFATLRALCDVVVVGAGTARAEGYGPAWLSGSRRSRRDQRRQSPMPPVAVVTSGADLDPTARLFTERRDDQPAPPPPYVFTSEAAPADRVEALRRVATVVPLGAGRVDLAAMVAYLLECGLGRILCEGGPGLLDQLVAAGLVDDLCLTYAPMLAGPGHLTLSGDPEARSERPPARFRLHQLLEGDGLVLARYVTDMAGGGAGAPRTTGEQPDE